VVLDDLAAAAAQGAELKMLYSSSIGMCARRVREDVCAICGSKARSDACRTSFRTLLQE
jgi:hypothetical protein